MRKRIGNFVRWSALLGAAVCLLTTGWAAGPQEKKDKPAQKEEKEESGVARFMRAKLASSQQVLEGLVTEDFKLVKTGAKRMQIMSRAAEWQVIGGPVYEQYSSDFRRSAEDLVKQAEKKNVDGATLTYMRLTMNCVNCHRFVRESKVAGLALPPELRSPQTALRKELVSRNQTTRSTGE
jgi:hypothetical protein